MVPSPEEVVEVIEEVGGSPEGSVAPTEGPAGVYGEGEELSAVPWEGPLVVAILSGYGSGFAFM